MNAMLSKKEQKDYLLSKRGSPIRFTYPVGEEAKTGILQDRAVWFDSEDEKVAYWNMVDLIAFDQEDEPWLRITYYRYKKQDNRWVFAGQTSISDPISSMVEFFSEVSRQRRWFRDFLEQVWSRASSEDLVGNHR